MGKEKGIKKAGIEKEKECKPKIWSEGGKKKRSKNNIK